MVTKFKNKCALLSFYMDPLYNFKMILNCFILFESRVTEALVYNFRNSSTVDIGFKYLLPVNKKLLTDTILLKVVKLESILNSTHSDYCNFKDNQGFKLNWSLIKKAFVNKCILKGKVLNQIYNGFSVGICGFVGFLPKKCSAMTKNSLNSIFVISSIDHLKNSFVLSQNRIQKASLKILFRLSSQILYVSKN